MLRFMCHIATSLFLVAAPAFAAPLDAPKGEVVLTVSGKLTNTNVEGTAQLDLAMLEALETTTIETTTIWTEGNQRFEGVSLAVLAEELGMEGTVLNATAINDYTVQVPMTDAVEGGPILAYRLNDKVMSVRDKGPLWIIYPYDSDPEYRTEVIYSRSIWQLDRIEVAD
ncbi:molybdopterin-dependent oxidoreductase [Alphaproteobacteria bacterium KMM 3653]|uniref:Molybdopterin-dependent oxidoreductase n=1 Tax=Harenicola maris TaxID=2841044 RepID=A0AAP2CN31_9RHOB|nr:molybdopterin-dependent oxidoreductase [Harenicola maris]